MQCQMNHDACHTTKTFPYAGQNLGGSYATDDTQVVKDVVASWTNEYNETTMNDINSFSTLKNAAGYVQF